jgi:hypothetical protein
MRPRGDDSNPGADLEADGSSAVQESSGVVRLAAPGRTGPCAELRRRDAN